MCPRPPTTVMRVRPRLGRSWWPLAWLRPGAQYGDVITVRGQIMGSIGHRCQLLLPQGRILEGHGVLLIVLLLISW
jgi:hypothetical protein